MKTSFTPQERDAFAKAVSAVEGLRRTDEQSRLFSDFDAKDVSLDDQIRLLVDRYSGAK